MESVKETDRIVEERTVLCINQAQEGDEAGATNRFKVVKVTDRQGSRGSVEAGGVKQKSSETGLLPYLLERDHS